jgi:3-hexulose-6-phosphate synthase
LWLVAVFLEDVFRIAAYHYAAAQLAMIKPARADPRVPVRRVMSTAVSVDLQGLAKPIVQISLDLTSLSEALDTAAIAVEAGVDWLEAGTPLLLAEGLHAVEGLHKKFPNHPIVADLKTMDGGYLEAEMMAKAGASFVVVMGRAHEATIRRVVDAGRDFGCKVMGDNLGADDRIENARWLESLGCDVIIHHIGYDERRMIKGLSPMDELDDVVRAVKAPVQAVGGLTIKQAIDCPAHGANLVVLGAPLVIDGEGFKPAGNNLFDILKEICGEIRKTPMRRPT